MWVWVVESCLRLSGFRVSQGATIFLGGSSGGKKDFFGKESPHFFPILTIRIRYYSAIRHIFTIRTSLVIWYPHLPQIFHGSNINLFAESTKPGVNVTVISLEPNLNSRELQDDLCVLADLALPTNFMTEVFLVMIYS